MDLINDVYFGKSNIGSKEKTRARIHYICSKVKTGEILDVGCSQGITCILLARENNKIIGIDIDENTIISANDYLKQEGESVQGRIKFECTGFIEKEFNEKLFDTVIMTEVLEHLVKPEEFIKKTYSLLKSNGRIVVTVPFCIMDYHDHKKTYYLLDMFDMLEPYFDIEEVKIIENEWIAFIGNKAESIKKSSNVIEKKYLKLSEKEIYKKERNHINRIVKLNEVIESYKKREENYKKLEDNYKNIEVDYKDYKEKINKKIEELTAEKNEKLTEADKNLELLKTDLERKNCNIVKLENEIDKLNEEKSVLNKKYINMTNEYYSDTKNYNKTLLEISKQVEELEIENNKIKKEYKKYKQRSDRINNLLKRFPFNIAIKFFRIIKKIKSKKQDKGR